MSYAGMISNKLAVKATFSEAATSKPNTKPKYPPPFSLRLTNEEKERLKAEAGKQPLGAFIRMKLLGSQVA